MGQPEPAEKRPGHREGSRRTPRELRVCQGIPRTPPARHTTARDIDIAGLDALRQSHVHHLVKLSAAHAPRRLISWAQRACVCSAADAVAVTADHHGLEHDKGWASTVHGWGPSKSDLRTIHHTQIPSPRPSWGIVGGKGGACFPHPRQEIRSWRDRSGSATARLRSPWCRGAGLRRPWCRPQSHGPPRAAPPGKQAGSFKCVGPT